MNRFASLVLWAVITIAGASSFAALALSRGESVNAVWLVTAALSVYFIAYRFYSKFIADKVLRLDPARPTPAVRHNDGLDYVPTNKWVLYGHHFAAIAGAGRWSGRSSPRRWVISPARCGSCGVVVAGAVQDFIVLFASVRRDGKSLGEMIKMELGPIPGSLAWSASGDHDHHPCRTCARGGQGTDREPLGPLSPCRDDPDRAADGLLHADLPARACGRGLCLGVALLLLSIVVGRTVAADPTWAPVFTLTGPQLAWA
jgi:carbon starvation protein